ncbi:hypothetical protein GGI25_001899 [Coemansia spiralis]|uniref:Uncharacterized protein n=2 Tax=Coemansia TaxID=4863 RepID=A0A9W8KZT6_9FUNG|nr:hypothetical protein BX070DRAFT_224862 [Coemansia spiralis]KAJ1993332.1 hypothetical protein EDC05_002196 [Coemansia umbellata]KAJ2623519.1 hypothetical protein GGI26_002358 [Coemansia sp. RSA 1358]KAJ2678910.1 hypothetical protein GGI25_001899 [Coemansia spiralis]
MDYRDADGYFREDVYRVLGRGSIASSMTDSGPSTAPARYRLSSSNFTEQALSDISDYMSKTDTSSDSSESASENGLVSRRMSEQDAEWEEAKHVLYTAVIGVVLPMTFRFIGRRVTFSMWARFLTAYFN